RVLFAVPWHNYVVVGTTDTAVENADFEPHPQPEEIDFILENASAYMTKQPKRKDVLSVFSGLRPLAASEDDTESTKEVSRHHKVMVSTSGLVSILGGKWTTYRKIAEDTINTAIAVGGLPERKCNTELLPIHGFDYASNWDDPMHVYGTDAEKIRELSKDGNESLSKAFYISPNTIQWACKEEMAITLEDMLARRSRALFLNSKETLKIAPEVAKIMAKHLKKKQDWVDDQLKAFTEVAQHYLIS
ncbi:MAG: FAD-dependent oxidoreductase, partial [Flavobacteriaceae bacterium]